MPAPRRFRRRLLLPPGWVALGFLLLLGCLLLQAHRRQLRPVNILQFTMFPLKQDTTGFAYYRRYGHSADTPSTIPYQSTEKLNQLRPWHSIDFGGQSLSDFIGAQMIAASVKKINADSGRAGGVRVRLRRGAAYKDMVKVLDIMLSTNQKKYWFDMRRQPSTLYVITDKLLPKDPSQAPLITCGLQHDVRITPPVSPAWQRFLAAYGLPAWRLPWLLLLALGASGAYKLGSVAKKAGQAT